MLTHLSHLGLLQVKGDGAKALLQGQLTCNLDEITPTTSRLGAHCNPQGRILSLFRLWWFQEAYYLQMPVDVLPLALAALKKYAGFYKVTLSDVTPSLACYFYQGSALEVTQPNDTLILALPGNSAYEIIGTPAHALGEPDSDINLWKRYQIENGIPTIYANTSGTLLPQELNLEALNAVSFNKGCYTGQEIIARMHYRGTRKKSLFRARVKTENLPAPGADIYLTNAAGTVVDSCTDAAGYAELLVVANIADVENDTLSLDPGKTQPLEFLPLPSSGS